MVASQLQCTACQAAAGDGCQSEARAACWSGFTVPCSTPAARSALARPCLRLLSCVRPAILPCCGGCEAAALLQRGLYLKAQLQGVAEVLRDLVHANAAHCAHGQSAYQGVGVPRVLHATPVFSSLSADLCKLSGITGRALPFSSAARLPTEAQHELCSLSVAWVLQPVQAPPKLQLRMQATVHARHRKPAACLDEGVDAHDG